MSVEEIRALTGTRHRAIIVKALRDHHGGDIVDWVPTAIAILDALDEAGTSGGRPWTAESYGDAYQKGFEAGLKAADEDHDAANFDLTVEQEIRARALDATARILGSPSIEINLDEDLGDAWLKIADDAARFIATGEITVHAEPAPPLEGGGAAGEAADVQIGQP